MKQNGRSALGIIIVVIVVGVAIITDLSYLSYSKIIRDDVRNISKLTSTNVYSEIDNELTKPIFVGLTMANDEFVKDWLSNEASRGDTEIVNYLDGIRKKYDYSSVFLVSDATRHYYHYNGLFKTIEPDNEHDQWYYDFSKQPESYILDVDQDEVDRQLLTIFINCKILDGEGNQIGVTGVGVEMDYVQKMLTAFEGDYNLEAFLVDTSGLVQAHTNAQFIENRNIAAEDLYAQIGEDLYRTDQDINVFHLGTSENEQYIISHYIDELGWYLIVRKDTSALSASLKRQIQYDVLITFFILVLVVGIVYKLISSNQRELQRLALTDALTGLSNRRAFDDELAHMLLHPKANGCLFVMDLDGFKAVNDQYGHLQGDKVLMRSVELLKMYVEHPSALARWGGDEFAGIYEGTLEACEALLKRVMVAIAEDEALKQFGVTVSIGLTRIQPTDTADSVVRRADQALYTSKGNGKGQITIG